MHKYNHHFPDNATPDSLTSDRAEMLKEIFGAVGKGVYIEPPVNIDYGCNVTLGDGFYSNFKYDHQLILTRSQFKGCLSRTPRANRYQSRNSGLRHG